MDVKDYSQKLSSAKDHFREVENELKNNYNKSTDELKKSNIEKTNELSKNYDGQKFKLEEQNQINNDNYSQKTKEEIAKRQEGFRNEIKNNVEKFDQERNDLKKDFREKLNNISDSFDRSINENDRSHQQSSKSMSDRYQIANKSYKDEFANQVNNLEKANRDQFKILKDETVAEKSKQSREHQQNLDEMRTSAESEKFKEISKLKNDNESLKSSFAKDKQIMEEQQQSRTNDFVKSKNADVVQSQNKFNDLQKEMRSKNNSANERSEQNTFSESKELERKFANDLKSMKRMNDQKILGGTEVSNLKEENKQLENSYKARLDSARTENKNENARNLANENNLQNDIRQKIKELKDSKVDALDKKEKDLNFQHGKKFQELKERDQALVDHYKEEKASTLTQSQDQKSKLEEKSSNRYKNQRIEFGKFINNMNEKNNEEINVIKDELTKDKSSFMVKTQQEFIDEKTRLRSSFNQQLNAKDELFNKKLDQVENETGKIIENYEKKLNTLARKADREVETLKAVEEERKAKEAVSFSLALETQNQEHKLEIDSLRDKYENIISKDRVLNDKKANVIIQKYEDQIETERTKHQKELSSKLSELQSQFQRLYKSTEMEKNTMRSHYEDRIENLLSTGQSDNSKKS